MPDAYDFRPYGPEFINNGDYELIVETSDGQRILTENRFESDGWTEPLPPGAEIIVAYRPKLK